MKEVILSLAISFDGMIVDENRNYDWIVGDGNHSLNTVDQFDFSSFSQSCGVIIMGKTSFDDIPIETIEDYKNKRFIVLTHSKDKPKYENVEFYSGNLSILVEELKNTIDKDIWIFGGSSVSNILIKTDSISKYIIAIIPVILGKGTRLFHDDNPKLELQLENYSVDQGIVILTYTRKNINNNVI
mgnify:CR=1 FL=1